jgi:hypothetical protein
MCCSNRVDDGDPMIESDHCVRFLYTFYFPNYLYIFQIKSIPDKTILGKKIKTFLQTWLSFERAAEKAGRYLANKRGIFGFDSPTEGKANKLTE